MEWKEAYSYPDYEVSDKGIIRRKTSNKLSGRWPVGREMTQQTNNSGYYRVKLNGEYVFTAKVVAETFICPRPDKHQVNHKNGDKKDNSSCNLEWVTQQENIRHAHINGLMNPAKGERHGNSKLTEDAVREIRSTVRKTAALAKKFGVDKSLIKYVRRRKIWAHVK